MKPRQEWGTPTFVLVRRGFGTNRPMLLAECGCDSYLGGRLRGDCCRRGIEQDFVDRGQLAEQAEERDELRGRCRSHRSIQELRLKLASS